MVSLEKITPNNYRECLNLKVTEEQKHFVSPNVLSLAKAYVYDDVVPFAIYNESLMVGFIMIRFNKEQNNSFIWQFMIDEKYQSKGYGSKALGLAIEWMKKNSRCHEIVTTYIDANDKAKKLYEKYGFQQMGELTDGEVDMVSYI
ncbi:GNAT family N-acetyltransferase [Clostridium swellfunianum]|uniref:GNAT family N-acetyltransferase n=1 Tax=Clostridium swellfunianum TaxID=1367462 RepID=UPI00202DC3FC|nr:GNAT family N-acetyltransferase [Clostridium swellfunianum]MCM0648898.1 GNAT family N-acetyltransferase [Clostridium swellfunianum]